MISVEMGPRRDLASNRILAGAIVCVRVGDHVLVAEHGDVPAAEQAVEQIRAAIDDETCATVHVITADEHPEFGEARVAAVFAGSKPEEAARELAMMALNEGSDRFRVRTMTIERAASDVPEIGAADAAGIRVETQAQAIERMRVQANALIEGWVASRTVPTEIDAAQVLAGLGLAKLCSAGVPFSEIIHTLGNLWDTMGGRS